MRNLQKFLAVAAQALTRPVPPVALFALSVFGPSAAIGDDQAGMARIPAGPFTMGSDAGRDDERPVRQVELDAFFIDVREVTVERYGKCVEAGKCEAPATGIFYNWGKPDRKHHPVNGVDWKDAENFCRYEGKRLPTEAEWEKAATWKDGVKYEYPSGKDAVSCREAVMSDGGDGCGRERTWPVGSKPEEINGTYDMSGNVWEWVADWKGNYPAGKPTDPQGPASGQFRVSRGGSWNYYDPSYLRGAGRYENDPKSRSFDLGFRCVAP